MENSGEVIVGLPLGNNKVHFGYYPGVELVKRRGGGSWNLLGIDGRFMAHTHGGAGNDRHFFLNVDKAIAEGGNMQVFMSDYQGNFRVYHPSMESSNPNGVDLCSGCVPTLSGMR